MVCFTCSECGRTVDENQVKTHCSFQCHSFCMDCGTEFWGKDYTKCITEDKKYGKEWEKVKEVNWFEDVFSIPFNDFPNLMMSSKSAEDKDTIQKRDEYTNCITEDKKYGKEWEKVKEVNWFEKLLKIRINEYLRNKKFISESCDIFDQSNQVESTNGNSVRVKCPEEEPLKDKSFNKKVCPDQAYQKYTTFPIPSEESLFRESSEDTYWPFVKMIQSQAQNPEVKQLPVHADQFNAFPNPKMSSKSAKDKDTIQKRDEYTKCIAEDKKYGKEWEKMKEMNWFEDVFSIPFNDFPNLMMSSKSAEDKDTIQKRDEYTNCITEDKKYGKEWEKVKEVNWFEKLLKIRINEYLRNKKFISESCDIFDQSNQVESTNKSGPVKRPAVEPFIQYKSSNKKVCPDQGDS